MENNNTEKVPSNDERLCQPQPSPSQSCSEASVGGQGVLWVGLPSPHHLAEEDLCVDLFGWCLTPLVDCCSLQAEEKTEKSNLSRITLWG
mmetsp:Transcript_525/g.1316  ORF Transcript_525/g.1316 Transcript_525/m.1316 type:complete len:90 (+) Transcript_525:1881-2150(+)